ncbi:unconventional myosin-XVIIIb isoform X2 [Lepisosteus oculatus]|uniref:unconventional myosin-XVIIIb isoform X2 n=1 Tax=Lepisosteus oculatus TaxID=7918 RepID=UPI0035F5004A
MSSWSPLLVNGVHCDDDGQHQAATGTKKSARRMKSPKPGGQGAEPWSAQPQKNQSEEQDTAHGKQEEAIAVEAKEDRQADKELKEKEGEEVQKGAESERQEPEGQTAESSTTEQRDVWYEACQVWHVHRDGFTPATQLKPDVGTPELPEGRVRVRLETDGSVLDVQEDEIEKANPPEQALAEDLSTLQCVNESSVLHTLITRSLAQQHLTLAGPNMIALRPPPPTPGKASKLRRPDPAPSLSRLLAQRLYGAMLRQRKDQTLVSLGRSGAGKTTGCQDVAEELIRHAGTAGSIVTVEKLKAVLTVLRAFGCVKTRHCDSSSRFSMVLSLDFNHAGRVSAAHVQTMLLEHWRVTRRPEGEDTFHVFKQLLAGLSPELRTELHLHQMAEGNLFGITSVKKVEEKQKAAVAFGKLQAALGTLGLSDNEQRAIWHVLAGIYHLGAAGACKVGRRQFLQFDSAQHAAAALGCEGEELSTAVFKHHLLHLLQQATGGARERPGRDRDRSTDGPRLTAVQCVEGMAVGLYEELFSTVVSLINRSLSSQQLTLGSVMLVDTPGFQNPRHGDEERAAGFAELCHNYVQERLLDLCYQHTFSSTLQRYQQEGVSVLFEPPETSPAQVVCLFDQPTLQVRSANGAPQGLLWVLDEEVLTPGSSEAAVLERVCSYFGDTVRPCEQPLQCEVAHQLGGDPVRYDLSGWFSLVQANPSAANASTLLQHSSLQVVRSLFAPRSAVPPFCRGLGGVEGGSQRSLQRAGIVRKTFSGGQAALRGRSACVTIKLQADALINLLRRSRPTFLHCMVPRGQGGARGTFDVPALRTQLRSTHTLHSLQLHRAGYPDHMSLCDFRCRFQALSPQVMKRYGSVFITPDERKAVEELLVDLDLEKRSIVIGLSQVFMKRGVLASLEQQREKLVSGWLVLLQAACQGHLARQRYRRMKVQEMAVRCVQRNMRVLSAVRDWAWWRLLGQVRPLLDVNIDDQRYRAKEEELCALRRRLEKSDKERNDLRQSADSLETKVTALTSELTDERFRGDALCQALDSERAERLRLARENKELQGRLQQVQVCLEEVEKKLVEAKQEVNTHKLETTGSPASESEWQLRYDCAQTEIEFLRKRLRQSEERLESELGARRQLEAKLADLQTQCEESKRSAATLRRRCRHVTSDLQDARVLIDSLQTRSHELERKQRRFDAELAQALEEAANERTLQERGTLETTALQGELFTTQHSLQESQAAVSRLEKEKMELSARIADLSSPQTLSPDSAATLKRQLRELETCNTELELEISRHKTTIQQQEQTQRRYEMEMERMKQIHQKELEDKEEELDDVQKSSQRRLRQLEMQLEQEYEQKQLVVHEKHDLEGLIATLCEQIGHRDFDVEKRLRRDLKRTHALLSDAQLLLSTLDSPGQGASRQELDRLHCQLEESEARCAEALSLQRTLAAELENAQLELENICRHKSLVENQLVQLQHEKSDLLKRLEEDQDDLNELMKKHKTLIAQSSSDIVQIRDLQAELEEVKKERQSMQEKLELSESRIQHLERSMVERSIVSRQEALVTDLENKLEFQRGQIKRFEALVLRLRDSVVRLGEELEQAADSEAREKESSRYYQQRLAEMRVELEELAQRELESSRRRIELEMQVEELTAVRQTLQADLETSIRRIADLQTALEEESSDESDSERDNMSSLGSLASEEVGDGIRSWLGVPRGRGGSPYGGSTAGSMSRLSDTLSTHSYRSLPQEAEETRAGSALSALSLRRHAGSGGGEGEGAGRAPSSLALSEFLEELRRSRAGEERSVSPALPIYQTTGASLLRRRGALGDSTAGSAGDPTPHEGLAQAPGSRPSILKPPSPLLARSASLRSLPEVGGPGGARLARFGSCDSLSSLPSGPCTPNPPIPEEEEPALPRSPLAVRRRLLGLAALAGGGGGEELPPLGAEPLVFRNRRLLGPLTDEETGGRESSPDILPAIRRAHSSSSPAGGPRRTLCVRFGELPPSRAAPSRSDDSGSDSSSSGGSQRPLEGGEKAVGKRLEAEGSEGDVNSVMMKYLRKAEAD